MDRNIRLVSLNSGKVFRFVSQNFFVNRDNAHLFEIEKPMISFKGAHFPKDVIDFMLFEHRDEAAATAFFK